MDDLDYLRKNNNLSSNTNIKTINIEDEIMGKQPIVMKRSKKIRIIMWSSSIALVVLGGFLFFYSFGNLSDRGANLSQGEILQMTAYSKKDTLLIRQLKDKALSDWIATRNTTKLTELSKNERIVTAIMSGDLPEEQLSGALEELSKNVNANTQEIQQLKVQYEVAVLKKNTNNLMGLFNNVKVGDWKSQQGVIEQGNKVLKSLNSASSVWLQSENADYSLLEEINDGVDKLNLVQSQFDVVKKYSEMLKQPTQITDAQLVSLDLATPLASQLSTQYGEVTQFVDQNYQLLVQKEAIERLKDRLTDVVDIPDFVGKTVKESKKVLEEFNKKNKSTLKIQGIDGAKGDEVVLTQTPSVTEFDKMKKDGVVTLTVQIETVESSEAPKTSVKPSSSSSVVEKSESKETTETTKVSSTEESSEKETQHVDEDKPEASTGEEQESTTVHVDK